MQQQMDVTGGLNTGGAPSQPPLQQQQQPAGTAPGMNTQPQGPPTPPGPQQQGQHWQSPLGTSYDPRTYQQAIDDALAAQAMMQAALPQAVPPMPAPGFDPSFDPYYDPYYDPGLDPREAIFHEAMGGYEDGLHGPGMGDLHAPLGEPGEPYEEMLGGLPGMVDSLVEQRLHYAQARRHALDSFFEDYPALAAARDQITRVIDRGVSLDEILQMLVSLNPNGATRQSPPSLQQRRQLRNETFVETGAADPYVDPISDDDERMIRAAAKQLFGG